MKQDYLESLELALELYDITNKAEILEKYKKRYEFGLEAGLGCHKIEEMLGNPKDIAKALWEEATNLNPISEVIDYDYTEPQTKKGYNLIIKTVADDIIIKESNDNDIHTSLTNINTNCYNIKNDEISGLVIDFRKKKYFSLNRKNDGEIVVEVPKNMKFDKVEINTTSGSIEISSLNAEEIEMVVVSGNADFDHLKGNDIKLQTVSGDISGYSIEGNDIKLHTVSGDITITNSKTELLRVDTVSGDVKIKESIGNIKSSSVTGNVVINGTEGKSLKKIVKGVFK